MKCKILLRIVVIFLFTTVFLYSISLGATTFYEDDYYLSSRAFSNEESYNMYAGIYAEYNKQGDFYNFLNPYLNNISTYHYYKIEDVPIVVTSKIMDGGGGYTYYIDIIPGTSPNTIFLKDDTYSYIRPNVTFGKYYHFWRFTIVNKDFSSISGGSKQSRFFTTNQPVYLQAFITDISNTSYANTKIAFANYDFLSEDKSQTYFYGTFLRYKSFSTPFMTSLKKYMKDGFSSDDYIEVVINDFPNLKGDGSTLNDFNLTITNSSTGEEIYKTTFNRTSPYYTYVEGAEDMPFYKIPVEDFYQNFSFGETYSFSLEYEFEGQTEENLQELIYGHDYSEDEGSSDDNTTVDNTTVIIGGMTNSIIQSNDKLSNTIIESNDKLQNSIDEQTNTIKENTETNKNIFEKIGEILSYINPLSENFFGKKLVDLIVEALKTLFVPDEEFLKGFLNDFDTFLTEHFGLLYQPFEMVIDLLNRFLNINLEDPSINIPDIIEPFTGEILIPAFEFKFNTILETEEFNYIYQIYLLAVDAMLVFVVINQIKRIEREVFGK